MLAFAKKRIEGLVKSTEAVLDLSYENDLEFLGLMAEMDPPREESFEAVAECRRAGIKPIMITGDHKITASAIAKRIGIMEDGDIAVTGPELDEMSQDELMGKLEKISLYARVSPSNKIRIVKSRSVIHAITSHCYNMTERLPSLNNSNFIAR